MCSCPEFIQCSIWLLIKFSSLQGMKLNYCMLNQPSVDWVILMHLLLHLASGFEF